MNRSPSREGSKAKAPGTPHRHAEGTNKGLDEGLNPAPLLVLHDPLPVFGEALPLFGDGLLHKGEEEEAAEEEEGLPARSLRLKQIGACSAPVPARFGEGGLILRLAMGGGGENGDRGRRGIGLAPKAVVVSGGVGTEGGDGGGSEGSGGGWEQTLFIIGFSGTGATTSTTTAEEDEEGRDVIDNFSSSFFSSSSSSSSSSSISISLTTMKFLFFLGLGGTTFISPPNPGAEEGPSDKGEGGTKFGEGTARSLMVDIVIATAE